MAKAKSNIAKRVMTDAVYERTRENIAEFERAAKAGKLFTDAFRVLATKAKDDAFTARINKEMMKVLQTDGENDRGLRTVVKGDIALLKGIEFNKNAKLNTLFFAPYTASVDRATGILKVDISAYVPKDYVVAPPKATHFSLISAAAEVNFATGIQSSVHSSTPELVYGAQTEAAVSLSNTLTANSTNWLFLALGIRFYQQVNGKYYVLNSGKFNAVSVIELSGPAA